MLIRFREDERGIAMVVALMVAFVVLLLGTVVFGQAIHNGNQSAFGRKRLTSVTAAEAGLNYWYNYLQQTTATSISTAAVTRTVGSSPASSSFTATPTFYSDATGTTLFSGAISSSNFPLSVKIKSVGTVNSVSRTMESFLVLRPIYGGFNGAVISNLGTSFGNNFQINGNSGNDGDVYILSGNLSISNSPVIYGSVYVPNGTLTMSNSSQIKGNAWANGNMSLTTVGGYAKSSAGNITAGSVTGDATATGTIAAGVTAANKYPGTNPGAVPTQTFPQITSSTSNWTSQGYTLQTFNSATACTDAYNWIHNTGAGTWATSGLTDVVIRINPATPCTLANGNNDTNTIRGNLAILNDGGFDLSNRSNWNGTSSPIKNVFFVSVYTGAACSGTTKNISVGNNTNFDSYTNVFFYTPCTATMGNTNNFAGQVIGGTVNISNQFTETYVPIVVPGANLTGYNQDIAYMREVI